jgi:hypothetical protein
MRLRVKGDNFLREAYYVSEIFSLVLTGCQNSNKMQYFFAEP